MKRGGGRRYYRPEDVALLRGIRLLLYSDGYTIRGVQKILREHGTRYVMDYEGLGDQPAADEAMAQDGSDVATEVTRTSVSDGLGAVDDDLSTVFEEIAICRQILADADRRD